jgi:hypothetical protein
MYERLRHHRAMPPPLTDKRAGLARCRGRSFSQGREQGREHDWSRILTEETIVILEFEIRILHLVNRN